MRKYYKQLLLSLASILAVSSVNAQFIYLNPLPGSKYRNPQTTLAIRNGALIDRTSFQNKNWLDITGSRSGVHEYTSRLSDDGKTIIVKPRTIFFYNETVSVTIHDELRKEDGKKITGSTFSFQTRDSITTEMAARYKQSDLLYEINETGVDPSQQSDLRDFQIDSLPAFTITTNNNAAPGQIFYGNQNDLLIGYTNCFATILENDGSLTWAHDLSTNGHDFKINYNGYMTFFRYSTNYWVVMDSNYNYIDSVHAENGYEYETNSHDVTIYPDGHSLLIIANKQTLDMTAYGGKPEADVTGVILQELDKNKDVVTEWSGWDHFEIDDAVSTVPLTNYYVDYAHPNAFNRDADGNWLLSCRYFNEITKINSSTGEIIWRLGGENNQFTFVNDNISTHFSYQHDMHRIANGNLTLFNNGNFLSPQKSSAKEYQLDEVNKVATLVWYYEHPDVNALPVYTPATGSAQRLPNGNTIISWGTVSTNSARPSMTEVDSLKNITWEMKFVESGQKAYRVHKYDWRPCAPVNSSLIDVIKITSTTAKVTWSAVKDATAYDLHYRKLGNTTWKLKNTTNISKKLINLTPEKSYEFQLRTYCLNGYVSDWSTLDTFTTLPAKTFLIENENEVAYELFPNPASDVVSILFTGAQEKNIQATVFNISGKKMIQSLQNFSAGDNEFKIDVSDLPQGVYLIEMNDGISTKLMKLVKL